MRTGRLNISRGYQRDETAVSDPPPRLALVREQAAPAPPPAAAPPPEPALPASPDYHAVHDRLSALERLACLFGQGALTAEEFAAEKLLILGLPADELVLREAAPVHFVPAAPRRARQGPSLVGRMLSWRFLLFSLVMGVGFSFAAQPDETLRLFDQLLRNFGA